MRFDDTKLRAQVREETLREVAAWCAERMDEAFARGARSAEATYLAAMNHCLSLIHPAPTEDDGFTTVRSDGRWWDEAAWTSVDGGLDG